MRIKVWLQTIGLVALTITVLGAGNAAAQATNASPNKRVFMPAVARNHATIVLATPGRWEGPTSNYLYVTPDSSQVVKFSVAFNVNGCGVYRVTTKLKPTITNGAFRFTGSSFHGDGRFSSPSTVAGTWRLTSAYIFGCGYVSGGPFTYSATWANNSQPNSPSASAIAEQLPMLEAQPAAAQGSSATDEAELSIEQLASPAAAPASPRFDMPKTPLEFGPIRSDY